MEITKSIRKSMIIRPSGRSTDFIAPSFGHGCVFNCTYCYMKRHKPENLDIATNINEILSEIDHHSWFATVKKPNQTHNQFITYDLSCNEDFVAHSKFYDIEKIFDFFKNHPIAFGSFATKKVNKYLLKYNPNQKIRIRFSLMPQKYSEILEPNTSDILNRIWAINEFLDSGYEVHINFSPVIYTHDWLQEYERLFSLINFMVKNEYKNQVKCEVIFLTHNKEKHEYNLLHKLNGEDLLWQPLLQEDKISQYGGENIRYKQGFKKQFIKEFIELHDKVIPWNKIRYIF